MFPILSRITAPILPTPACLTDAERLFSNAGKICSPDRSVMGSKMIDLSSVMNWWFLANVYERKGMFSEVFSLCPSLSWCRSTNWQIGSDYSPGDEDGSMQKLFLYSCKVAVKIDFLV